jgi:hypothetical protein
LDKTADQYFLHALFKKIKVICINQVVCLFVFTRPGGTHDRCFQPVTRFLPSFGPEPTEGGLAVVAPQGDTVVASRAE